MEILQSRGPLTKCRKCIKDGVTCKVVEILGINPGRMMKVSRMSGVFKSVVPIEECSVLKGEQTIESYTKEFNHAELL